jgi:hypothetical protein
MTDKPHLTLVNGFADLDLVEVVPRNLESLKRAAEVRALLLIRQFGPPQPVQPLDQRRLDPLLELRVRCFRNLRPGLNPAGRW